MKTLIKNLFILVLCMPLTLSAQLIDHGTYMRTDDNLTIGASNDAYPFYVRKDNDKWQGIFINRGGEGADVYLSHGKGYGMYIKGWTKDSKYTLKLRNLDDDTNVFYNNGKVGLGLAGNVGIGTTTPAEKLHVAGNLYTTGSIKSASRTYYFGDIQQLYGGNGAVLYYKSNNSNSTQLIMRDKENVNYGTLCGNGNGTNFGLLDGDGNWSYLAVKDNYTAFHINSSEKMRIKSNGNVGIGTANPTYKLSVNGNVRAKEVRVETGWSDYVFYDDYQLPTLEEEEQHIQEKGHLLGFESEKDMRGEVSLGNVSKRQQAKIEEMMLHLIQINEQLQAVEAKVTDLEQENTQLKKQLARLRF